MVWWEEAGMTAVVVALLLMLLFVSSALVVGVFDELRRPHSNVRRAGVALALLVGFAAAWLLTTAFDTGNGVICSPPLLVLAGVADCADQQGSRLVLGLLGGLAAPVAVLATRGRRE